MGWRKGQFWTGSCTLAEIKTKETYLRGQFSLFLKEEGRKLGYELGKNSERHCMNCLPWFRADRTYQWLQKRHYKIYIKRFLWHHFCGHWTACILRVHILFLLRGKVPDHYYVLVFIGMAQHLSLVSKFLFVSIYWPGISPLSSSKRNLRYAGYMLKPQGLWLQARSFRP